MLFSRTSFLPTPTITHLPPIYLKSLLLALSLFTLHPSLFSSAPPSPKELAKQLFQQLDVSDVRLTPGNRGLSYISTHRGTTVLKLLDLQTQATYQANIEGSPDVYDHYWIDRDTVLLFVQRLGTPIGAYTASYKLASIAPAEFSRVYDTLPDQKRIFIAKAGSFDEKFNDLYQVNAYTGSKTKIEENDGTVLAWFTDKDGVTRIRYTIDENERDQYAYRSGPDDEWRPIDIGGHPLGVLFLDEPETFVLFIRRDGTDKFAAYKFNGSKNEYTETLHQHDQYDIILNQIIADPETEETYGYTYDHDKPRTFWFDPALAEIHKTLQVRNPQQICEILGYDSTKSSVIYKRYSDQQPEQWRRYFLENKQDHLLLNSLPNIDTTQTAPTETISYQAQDDATIHGYLTRARTTTTGPTKTLLMIHGGPRARDYWGWDPEAQYFAALGYNVLKINYRGSTGYGIAFSPYSHLSSMQKSVTDAIDAAHWLIAMDLATPKQIAIYGSSFGGHVAFTSVAQAPELFSAAIGYAGVYDWPTHLEAEFKNQPIYATLKMDTYYPDFQKNREKWYAASALPQAESIDCPVFLIHGRSDETVSSTQSRRMHKTLKKADKDSTLNILNFNRHGVILEKNRITFYTEIAEFLNRSY